MPITTADTADKMLDVAERLIQTVGFNGFSYADIAQEIGVTKASLHYHFPTKAELGLSVIVRYHQNFFSALERIQAGPGDALQMLRNYVALYSGVLKKNRMCLCGMLAADFATLPKPMKVAVQRFFEANEAWLARILDDGRAKEALGFESSPQEMAQVIVSSLEGAMMIARSFSDVARFEAAANCLLDGLSRRPLT